MIETVRKGTELKDLSNTNMAKEFSEGACNSFHIIKAVALCGKKLVPPIETRKKLLSKLHKSNSPRAME